MKYCMCFLATCVAGAVTGPAVADWPQFLGPNRDGRSPESGLLAAWGKAGPRVVWKVDGGAGYSQVVVSVDRAAVVVVRAGEERIVTLAADTGKEIWSKPIGRAKQPGPSSTPAVDGDRLYVQSMNGPLVCLKAASGDIVWQRDLLKDLGRGNTQWGLSVSPLIHGNLLLTVAGGEGAGVLAVEKATGKLVWKNTDALLGHANTECAAWSLYLEPRGFEAPPRWFATWKGDGIIARFPAREPAVVAKGVPIVDLYGTLNETELPQVAGDNQVIGRLIFSHFWERGIRSFAFYAWANRLSRYDQERQTVFCELAQAAGCSCAVFTSLGTSIYDWEKEQQRHVAWLQSLPKPVGVFLFNDIPAHRVLDLCRDAGVQVPDEVAVVTVGNDPMLCSTTIPPASSIEHDAEQIGYEAASLLDKLMQGVPAPRHPVRIAPRGLVVRLSSDMLAVDDPDVAAALRCIHDHACEGLRVSDLAERVAVSQSVLERKFLRLIGRTPKAEMLRVQLGRARQLLTGSALPLRDVARQCGFESDKYFSDAFVRGSGIRPLAYRKRHRQAPGG